MSGCSSDISMRAASLLRRATRCPSMAKTMGVPIGVAKSRVTSWPGTKPSSSRRKRSEGLPVVRSTKAVCSLWRSERFMEEILLLCH